MLIWSLVIEHIKLQNMAPKLLSVEVHSFYTKLSQAVFIFSSLLNRLLVFTELIAILLML
jgi:hypothetical protein